MDIPDKNTMKIFQMMMLLLMILSGFMVGISLNMKTVKDKTARDCNEFIIKNFYPELLEQDDEFYYDFVYTPQNDSYYPNTSKKG